MTTERLVCRCGIEVGIVRLNAKTLVLGHRTNPGLASHPVRLARQAAEDLPPQRLGEGPATRREDTLLTPVPQRPALRWAALPKPSHPTPPGRREWVHGDAPTRGLPIRALVARSSPGTRKARPDSLGEVRAGTSSLTRGVSQMATETATATCSARVGFFRGEWAEMPTFCSTSVGLVRYTDNHGIERAYCRHHKGLVLYRYPTSEQARVAAAIERISADFTDELDEDEPRDFDREGQPEFNGAFR